MGNREPPVYSMRHICEWQMHLLLFNGYGYDLHGRVNIRFNVNSDVMISEV